MRLFIADCSGIFNSSGNRSVATIKRARLTLNRQFVFLELEIWNLIFLAHATIGAVRQYSARSKRLIGNLEFGTWNLKFLFPTGLSAFLEFYRK